MSRPPSSPANLLAECNAHSIRLLLADDGGLTIDAPQGALTPDLLDRLKSRKPDLLTLLRPPPACDGDNATDLEFRDANEIYWSQIREVDRSYLLGPRSYPPPCAWCGGRLVHNPNCDELRQSWEPTIPFGKHAGKPVSAVSDEYLIWLLRQGISRELRDAIRQQLKCEAAR